MITVTFATWRRRLERANPGGTPGYPNWFLFFLLLLGKTTLTPVECSDVRKCCPSGYVLTSVGEFYSCESVPEEAPEFCRTTSGTHGLPVCEDGRLTTIPLENFTLNLPGDSCVDVLLDFENEDQGVENLPVILLFCSNSSQPRSENEELPVLLNVRRCCRRGETFSMEWHACLPSEDQEEISSRSLIPNVGVSDFIYAVRGPPKCEHAVVDYEANATDVSFVAGRLQVTASNSLDVVDLFATEESVCIDVGSSPELLVVRACRAADFCLNNICLRKCCPEDEALLINSCQKLPANMTVMRLHSEIRNTSSTMENALQIADATAYGLLIGNPCLYGMYPVHRNDGWQIISGGKVHVPGYVPYGHHQHCMDMLYNSRLGPDDFYAIICFEEQSLPPEEISQTRFLVHASLSSISCAFLLATLLVYICLPSLQNLHGKTLMCHVASLFMSYCCIITVAIATPEKSIDEDQLIDSQSLCNFLGYAMLFFTLSTFFWLNAMCFDIWWKFGSLRNSGKTNTKRRDDCKRFLAYCLYAWGLAFLFVIMAMTADTYQFLPESLLPGIGIARCWFSSGPQLFGEILFFVGPVSAQLVVNLVFFILTARRCSMVKAEIQRRVMVNRSDPRTRRFQADKTKLILNGKLFVVMGISWVFEVLSYFLNHYASDLPWTQEIFYVSDVVNCLQGLLIFVLFVLKKKVFHALKRKCGKGGKFRGSTGGVQDPFRVRKCPSSSTILSTFAASSSP